MTFSRIRKSRWTKVVSSIVALGIVQSVLYPTEALALTSGPSQPEFNSFEPVESSEMVNLFSGDFSYNIPLFELPGPNGGYPFNIAYQSGITMDQEASWVGLGWNINPGVINRSINGMPDDFNGVDHGGNNKDYVRVKKRMLPNQTAGLNLGFSTEIVGGSPFRGGVGLGVYLNNYKGFGYSLSPSFSITDQEGVTLGVGLSLDSQEGVGINPSLSLTKSVSKPGIGGHTGSYTFGLGLGFHSERGMSYSLNTSSQKTARRLLSERTLDSGATVKKYGKEKSGSSGAGSSSSLSISGAYASVPNVNVGTQTAGINVQFGYGPEVFSTQTQVNFGGFWRGTFIKDEYKDKYYEPVGYNYLQEIRDTENGRKDQLLDYTRQNESHLTLNSSNLPIPQMNYDMYSVVGQGIGGMFRPHRNSFAHLYKNEVTSNSYSGSVGFDMGGGGLFKLGVNGSITYGQSKTGKWKNSNGLENKFTSETNQSINDYEDFYFKFQGEQTTYSPYELVGIGREHAYAPIVEETGGVLFKHTLDSDDFKKNNNGSTLTINDFYKSAARKPRSSNIQHYTNQTLLHYGKDLDENLKHIPGEYNIKFYDLENGNNIGDWLPASDIDEEGNIITSKLDESNVYRKNHIGGFTILKENGNRYVYGIPVYNRKKVEATFSVEPENCAFNTSDIETSGNGVLNYEIEGTKKLLDYKETSAFAQSYLITSILGADYVDIDNEPGPSEGDMGYWVKFNYVKVDSDFQWRAPFANARYQPGFENNTGPIDDLGSYQYGKKELYYVASVETSSHIAVFDLEARDDAKGANGELNRGASGLVDNNSKSYRLSKIDLYSKSEFNRGSAAIPIKSIHFGYDYSLCTGIPNNDSGNGKLTLKELSFSYQNNLRGKLTPYSFEYNSNSNPEYQEHLIDRWGNYQPLTGINEGGKACASNYHSYVYQFDDTKDQTDNEKEAFKEKVDANASAWHLTGINLPYGGKIGVEYEADDYAYVQHRKANQMFRILGVGAVGDNDVGGVYTSNRKLIFKLEHPISSSDPNATELLMRYFEPLKRKGEYQLYFRTKIELRDEMWQNVSGWATFDPTDNSNIGFMPEQNGEYTMGYLIMDPAIMPDNDEDYNAIEVAGMGHLRMNQPDMITTTNAPTLTDPGTNANKVKVIKGLSSFYHSFMKIFKNFYKYCRERRFANKIDLKASYMRLGTPDGVKYGGGVRVKSIEVFDNWGDMTTDANESASYGQYYDYTTIDEATGEKISSGVAANEPIIGGEENALRYVKRYGQKMQPFSGENNLFFEYPVNAAYYPGASVGYSKVTVMSKNTREELDDTNSEVLSSTGVMVHEYYTAKDYPVISKETPIDKGKWLNVYVPIPFIGQVEINKMAFAQGYKIVLNDMHGKPKSQGSYAVGKNKTWKNNRIQKTEYIYNEKPFELDGTSVKELVNKVSTVSGDYDWDQGGMLTEDMIIGEDYEFFMESNENRSTSTMAGGAFDVDGFLVAGFPAFTPSFWPSYSRSVNQENYAVTNKVIYKTGVLREVVSEDEGAFVNVVNHRYDALTGEPLVVSTSNKFKVNGNQLKTYQYNIPAYWMYDGMGAAYKNFGFVFKGIIEETTPSGSASDLVTYEIKANSVQNRWGNSMSWTDLSQKLVSGDELIVYKDGEKHRSTVIQKGSTIDETIFHTNEPVSDNERYTFIVVRSGKRNQLSAKAGNMVSFEDPFDANVRTFVNEPQTTYSRVEMIAEFLNAKLNCDGELIEGHFDLELDRFDAVTGAMLYPEFAGEYDAASITNGTGSYAVRLESTFAGNENFTITISSPANKIVSFAASGSNLVVHFDNATTQNIIISNPSQTAQPAYSKQENVLSSSAVVYRDYWPANECKDCGYMGANAQKTQLKTLNPYATGEKGIYRPTIDYYYDAYRKQTQGLSLGEDGVYIDPNMANPNATFYAFNWHPNGVFKQHPYWKVNSTISQYNAKGFAVETRDALGIPSSAKYGYHGMLPVITGQNVPYCSLFSLNADDPSEKEETTNYQGYMEAVNLVAHTGDRSFRLEPNLQSEAISLTDLQFQGNRKYVFSAWGSNGYPHSTNPQLKDYTLANNPNWNKAVAVEVVFWDEQNALLQYNNSPQFIYPSGNKIDQWQRLEGEFTVPLNTAKVQFKLIVPSDLDSQGDGGFYWDDIRVYPVGSLVSTYVYDPVTLRLLATLDENNYSVQYSYDESGNLYSTRVETPKGIMSVNESIAHTKN